MDCVIDGIRIGFANGYGKCKPAKRNMQLASANSSVVDSYLRAEVEASRFLSQLRAEISAVQVSSNDLLPKNHQPWRWCLVVDLSSPRLGSVNEGNATDLCSLSYVSVAETTRRLLHLGPRALTAKLDIESATAKSRYTQMTATY